MVDRLSGPLQDLMTKHQELQTRQRPEYLRLDRYYEGVHRLQQLQLAIPTELEQFVIFVNWCRKAVDSVENRLDLIGFRMPDGSSVLDESTTETWTYNNMWSELTMMLLDMLSLSAGYISVGSNENDPEHPLITVDSPTEMSHILDGRTREVASAVRMYNPVLGIDQSATLYFPDETYWLERDGYNNWYIGDFDDHGLGQVPVVPFINRPRSHRLPNWRIPGVSQMHDVIPIVDAAARALTNAQVAQETVAVPQRGMVGATQADFIDRDGNPIPAWESYFGAVWAIGNKDAKHFQFDPTDMKNFETIVNLYARQASGVTGLPPNYFGLVSDDAASDSAIRSRETQLVKFAERQQTNTGNDIRKVVRLVDRFKTGDWNENLRHIEPLWRDAGTPTKGQVTDAAVKLKEGDILTREGVWEELNWSPARIQKEKERFEERDKLLAQSGVDALLQQSGLDEFGRPKNGNTGGGVADTRPTVEAAQS